MRVSSGYVRMPEILFPGFGSPMEKEIRRVEFDADRPARPNRKEDKNE